MSSDITTTVVSVAGLIGTVLLGLAAYRALSFRHVLVSTVYRSRALWTGIFAVVSIVAVLEYLLYLSGTIPLQAGFFPSLFLVVFFAVIDSSIRTALDQDHFHRNTLQWNAVRRALWPIVLAEAALNIALEYTLGYSLEFQPLAYGTVSAILGYSALVLVISSVRTPDVPMKRFVQWLGLTGAAIVGLGIVDYPVGISNVASNLSAAVAFMILVPVSSFFILKASMSFSPTGKLEIDD